MKTKNQPLADRVYTLLQTVPKGRVTTYKEIGSSLHSRGYRAIGQILKKNPYAPRVPCHRVVGSNGALGGFKGKTKGKAIQEKTQLLTKEGVLIKKGKVKDFKTVLYIFPKS